MILTLKSIQPGSTVNLKVKKRTTKKIKGIRIEDENKKI